MIAARRVIAVLAVTAVATATWVSGSRLEVATGERSADSLLYLPNGKHLRIISLGHESLLADAIYLWAIQYYSNYEHEDRYRYVEHVFEGVITELDPHHIDAYWLGAMILIVEAGKVEAGLRLLDKGIDNNPREWILPYLAAWESHHAGRFDRAEAYFARAAAVEGAPAAVRRMRAGMRTRSGDVEGALQLWQGIVDDPSSDARSVAIARRQVTTLRVKLDISRLRGAVERFRSENGRWPEKLEELKAGDYIGEVPRDPAGRRYRYDSVNGLVAPPDGRVLERT